MSNERMKQKHHTKLKNSLKAKYFLDFLEGIEIIPIFAPSKICISGTM